MAELVDAHDSKSCGVIHGSSILPPGTMEKCYFEFKELEENIAFEPSTLFDRTPFTQAKFYGDWQKFFNRKTRRFIIKKDNDIIGYFQLVKYLLPFYKNYLYLPYGPVTNDLSGEFLKQLKIKLKEIAKEEDSSFIRLDFTPAIKDHNQKKFVNNFFIKSLKSSYHSAYFQPRREWYLDLATNEKDLYESMHENHRYSVRLAQRKEIVTTIVSENFMDYLESFYELMSTTSNRNKFSLHPKDYYSSIFRNLDSKYAYLTVSKYQNKILAIDLIVTYGSVAHYVFACTSNEERNRAPAYSAIWTAILHAKSLGYKYFNFGGISTTDLPNKDWQGLTNFKKRFGGNEIHHSDFYDLVIDWPIYLLYTLRKLIQILLGH